MGQRNIHAEANGRWPSILVALGVDGKFLRNVHGPCPICGGKDRFRFDDKEGGGTFFCAKCGAGTGLDLVMKLRGMDFRAACGLVRTVLPQAVALPAKKTRREADTRAAARKVWLEAKRLVPADAGAAYLHARGLPFPPHALPLRTHQNLSYRDSEGNVIAVFPALIAAVQDKTGKLAAVHRIWVRNGVKAPVPNPKKTLGRLDPGCAVRLAPHEGVLAVAEGVETALAAAFMSGLPTWGLLNAGQLERFEWPEDVRELVIFGDRDSSFTGQKAAYTLAFRAHAKGLKADVMLPRMEDVDWLDEFVAGRAQKH